MVEETIRPISVQRSVAKFRSSGGRIIGLLGLLGLGLLGGALLLVGIDLRNTTHHNAVREASGTAYLLADHAARLFEVADVALRYGARATDARDWDEIAAAEDLYWVLKNLAGSLPYVEDVWLNDPTGELRLTSFAFPTPRSNAADRDVFKAVRGGADRVFVGERIIGRVTGRPTFLLARPLAEPDGSFRGMVSVTAGLAYFSDYWARVRLPFDARLTLLRADVFDVLAQHPTPPPGEMFVSPSPALGSAISQSPIEGSVSFASTRGGETRWAVYRRVGELPVYLTLSVSEAAVTQVWRNRMWNYAPFASAAALALDVTP